MKAKYSVAGAGLLIALIAAVFVASYKLEATRRENLGLQSHVEEACRENHSAPAKVQQPDFESTRELLSLRNEVRQLRSQQEALAKLREDTLRLSAEFARTNSSVVAAPTAEAGFLMNSHWSDAGLGTPEAAVQTFFWAARERNLPVLCQCLTARMVKKMRLSPDAQWSDASPETVGMFEMLGNLKGYRIREIREISPEEREIAVQAAIGGQVLKSRILLEMSTTITTPELPIGQWKIEMF